MPRATLLLVVSSALLAHVPAPLAATSGDLPTSCVIDGTFFDECPLGEDLPPWNGGGHGHLPLIRPDLGARGGGFAVTPSCLTPGRPFQAHAVIENFGGLDFGGDPVVQVDFYLVTPGTVGFPAAHMLGSTTIVFPEVTSAGLGEVGVLVSTSGDLPAIAPGQYQLGIDIDVGNLVLELNENNNKVVAGDVVAVGDCVDLVPALEGFSATSPVSQGETLTVTGSVRNEGDAALVGPRSFAVRYRAVPAGGDELSGTVLGVATVTIPGGSSLDPGATRIGPALSVQLELPPGNYAIGADVDHGGPGDAEGAVDEVDEENNSRLVGSIEVNDRPPGPPDYVVSKAKIASQERNPISAGFRLFIALRLADIGVNSEPGLFPEVRIVASDDQIIGNFDDFTLRDFPAAQSIFTFAPGAALSQLVTLEVPWPAELPAGSYTIGAIVDPQDEVAEQNENNNSALVGIVKGVVDCSRPTTSEQARTAFEQVFTSNLPLPVEPATHPALDGELCEFCFGCDKDIFVTEVDDCNFALPYLHAEIYIVGTLKPAMQRACVTQLAELVAADPAAVIEAWAAAKELKRELRLAKLLCDLHHDGPKRRYCACSNSAYLHWAPNPHPGECVYDPNFP